MQIMQYPDDPDKLAREAGKKIYGTVVGCLRRHELYRLGNAWGHKFPVGATKDFMIPFFIQLEANGKDPFRPPQVVPTRPEHSDESHADRIQKNASLPKESQVDALKAFSKEAEKEVSLEERVGSMKFYELRKLCKARGIPQTPKDRKVDLVARVLDYANGGDHLVQDVSERSE